MAAEIKEKQLFDEYKETRSIETRNQIVEKYLYIVDILVKKYLNKGVEYDDLYQVGSMALVLAVERFDVEKGFEFTSFATPTIIGEIKRYFRDKGWAVKVPRRLKEISSQIPAVKEELYGKLLRYPTIEEIAEFTGHSQEEILQAMESSQAYSTYSLNQTFDESGEEGDNASFEKYTGIEEAGFQRFEYSQLIEKVMETLTEAEKEIFIRRFLNNETQQDIAKALNVSQMTISRTEKRLKSKFRDEYFR